MPWSTLGVHKYNRSFMSEDPELGAMAAISRALGVLDEDAAGRVLRWAADRFSISLSPIRKGPAESLGRGNSPAERERVREGQGSGCASQYDNIADLYDAASPKTEADKALVAAYWH